MKSDDKFIEGKEKKEGSMFPIWFWIGAILTIYGVIISGLGIYYSFTSAGKNYTLVTKINPDLWWGGGMLLIGLVFLFVTFLFRILEKKAKT